MGMHTLELWTVKSAALVRSTSTWLMHTTTAVVMIEVCATGFVPDVGTADRTTKTRGTLVDVNIVNVQDDRSRGAPVVMDVRTGIGKTNTLGLLADVVVNVHDDSSRGAAVVLDVGLGNTLGLLAEVNIVNTHDNSSRDEVGSAAIVPHFRTADATNSTLDALADVNCG
jgi:hypothetical protein